MKLLAVTLLVSLPAAALAAAGETPSDIAVPSQVSAEEAAPKNCGCECRYRRLRCDSFKKSLPLSEQENVGMCSDSPSYGQAAWTTVRGCSHGTSDIIAKPVIALLQLPALVHDIKSTVERCNGDVFMKYAILSPVEHMYTTETKNMMLDKWTCADIVREVNNKVSMLEKSIAINRMQIRDELLYSGKNVNADDPQVEARLAKDLKEYERIYLEKKLPPRTKRSHWDCYTPEAKARFWCEGLENAVLAASGVYGITKAVVARQAVRGADAAGAAKPAVTPEMQAAARKSIGVSDTTGVDNVFLPFIEKEFPKAPARQILGAAERTPIKVPGADTAVDFMVYNPEKAEISQDALRKIAKTVEGQNRMTNVSDASSSALYGRFKELYPGDSIYPKRTSVLSPYVARKNRPVKPEMRRPDVEYEKDWENPSGWYQEYVFYYTDGKTHYAVNINHQVTREYAGAEPAAEVLASPSLADLERMLSARYGWNQWASQGTFQIGREDIDLLEKAHFKSEADWNILRQPLSGTPRAN
jgi:hypothetical protein